MTPFAFATATEIRFGAGVSAGAAAAAARLGRRVLVVTGASAERAAWLFEALEGQGLAVAAHAARGEPTVADARAAVAVARAHAAEVIIAVGGGAALDLGKAVAGLMGASDPMDHLEVVGRGEPLRAAPAPMIAIPTTAGTGSEVTRNAVLGAPEHGRKVSLRDQRLLPRLALVDPELLVGLPQSVALASGLDALVQVIEPYVGRFANPLTDALCRDAIPRGLSALPRLLAGSDGAVDDAVARADMAFTSLCGGLALTNARLGAVHGLAGVIGGRVSAPHGALCGRLAAPVLSLTEAALPPGHPASARFADIRRWIAEALGGETGNAWTTLAAFADRAGLPSLSAMGVAAADHARIAAEALKSSSTQGAPVDPDAALLEGALALA
ncbi:MAG: iron-containing alcohol dehydrogenase [Rubrimonas sp.]